MNPQPGETWLFDNGYVGLIRTGNKALEIYGLVFHFGEPDEPKPTQKLG